MFLRTLYFKKTAGIENKQKNIPKHKFYIFSRGSHYTLPPCMMSKIYLTYYYPYYRATSQTFAFGVLFDSGKVFIIDWFS